MRRVRHVLTENDRTLGVARLLEDGRIAEIGPLLSASHVSMRDDYEITVPEVDVAVATALDAGAVGARMTGGGFGGCIIALCPTGAVATVRDAVAAAFAARRFTPPEMFRDRPGGRRAPGRRQLALFDSVGDTRQNRAGVRRNSPVRNGQSAAIDGTSLSRCYVAISNRS